MNRSDFEKIKNCIAPVPDDHYKAQRRLELQKKSEDRVQHWPNTLEALRKKKESFLTEKEARDEAIRREIDLQVCLSLFFYY